MTTFRFVLDERSFDLADVPAIEVAPAIRALVNLVAELVNAGHGVCFDPDLFGQPIWDGRTFWELFGGCTDLSVPDWERAAIQFSTLVRWDETGTAQPAVLDVVVAGGPVEVSGTIAWARAQCGRGLEAAACISRAGGRALGRSGVAVPGGSPEGVWFVGDMELVRDYFRDLLARHARAPLELEELAGDAFPSLDFVDHAFAGVKSMSRGLPQIAPDLVRHLSALSDAGQEIFSGPWQDAEARYGGLGVDVSDENGRTKQNTVARRARTLKVRGVDRVFWWHTKLEPDRDRIHFDPANVPDGGRILVGIFCRHLTS